MYNQYEHYYMKKNIFNFLKLKIISDLYYAQKLQS